jgi:hypothetical protein
VGGPLAATDGQRGCAICWLLLPQARHLLPSAAMNCAPPLYRPAAGTPAHSVQCRHRPLHHEQQQMDAAASGDQASGHAGLPDVLAARRVSCTAAQQTLCPPLLACFVRHLAGTLPAPFFRVLHFTLAGFKPWDWWAGWIMGDTSAQWQVRSTALLVDCSALHCVGWIMEDTCGQWQTTLPASG